MILRLPIGNLNYYVMSNYKLRCDVDLHKWLEIRTWNLLGIEQTKDSQSLDCPWRGPGKRRKDLEETMEEDDKG